MKLLLGEHHKEAGYLTLDIHGTPDIEHDLNEPMPFLDDNSIEQIEGYHLFEHLKPVNVLDVIADWYRILKPNGVVIMELPDAPACMKRYLKSTDPTERDLILRYLWGNQDREGQYHYWGWSKSQLKPIFEHCGFKVKFTEPKDYHAQQAPCLRLEATKL